MLYIPLLYDFHYKQPVRFLIDVHCVLCEADSEILHSIKIM